MTKNELRELAKAAISVNSGFQSIIDLSRKFRNPMMPAARGDYIEGHLQQVPKIMELFLDEHFTESELASIKAEAVAELMNLRKQYPMPGE